MGVLNAMNIFLGYVYLDGESHGFLQAGNRLYVHKVKPPEQSDHIVIITLIELILL